MTAGSKSNADKSTMWRRRRIEDGYQRITIWAPPQLSEQITNYADEERVPLAVAVEMILRKFFDGDY